MKYFIVALASAGICIFLFKVVALSWQPKWLIKYSLFSNRALTKKEVLLYHIMVILALSLLLARELNL